MPERVVVLGASGFVGRDLMRRLGELEIPALGLGSGDVNLLEPDAGHRLEALVRKEDALVFVSALTPDKGRDIRTLMNNLAMAEQVCAFLAGSPCSHVVYVSSDAVYHDEANPVRETSCCSPSSFHGLNHFVRERMLATTLAASKTPLAILRPSLLYGAGDTHNGYGPNRFLRTAIKDRKIALFGQGEEKRDHVFVEDLSRLIGECLRHRSEGVLNVATGRSVSIRGVAEIVARLLDDQVAFESLPRSGPVTHRHFDVADAIVAFPSFRYTPPESGLAATFRALAGMRVG